MRCGAGPLRRSHQCSRRDRPGRDDAAPRRPQTLGIGSKEMPAYFRPKTLDEALKVRTDRPVAILAGGTDIYPAKAARTGWGDMDHADVLDISAIEDLRGIGETAT